MNKVVVGKSEIYIQERERERERKRERESKKHTKIQERSGDVYDSDTLNRERVSVRESERESFFNACRRQIEHTSNRVTLFGTEQSMGKTLQLF